MLTLWLPYRSALVLRRRVRLSFVAQGVKICVDTVVQRTVEDDFRGRVFTVYDTLFNVAFVAAAVVTALTLPESGHAPGVDHRAGGGLRADRRRLLVGVVAAARVRVARSAYQARSSASARSAPSGPCSIRSASKYR